MISQNLAMAGRLNMSLFADNVRGSREIHQGFVARLFGAFELHLASGDDLQFAIMAIDIVSFATKMVIVHRVMLLHQRVTISYICLSVHHHRDGDDCLKDDA